MLAEVVKNLKFSQSIYYERPSRSASALANAARVSRLFYELAIPLSWEEVYLWGPSVVNPYTLVKYPWAIEPVSPSIRTMHLKADEQDELEDKTRLNRLRKFASRFLNTLTAATSVDSLHLYLYRYKLEDHRAELGTRLKAINALIIRILRRAETTELDELGWHPGRETARSSNAVRIIERKITGAELSHVDTGEWVHDLHNQERLRSIEVINPWGKESSGEFDCKFWIAISRLDRCTKLVNNQIPIPVGWSLEFENLINLKLLFDFVETRQWINTVTAVFNYMPGLKNLCLSSPDDIDSRGEMEYHCSRL